MRGEPGNTSARAEKSSRRGPAPSEPRKYLRTRGEELLSSHSMLGALEIPPHARRRVSTIVDRPVSPGNTSARAEKRLPQLEVYTSERRFFVFDVEKVADRSSPSKSIIVRRLGPSVLIANPCSRRLSSLIMVKLPSFNASEQRRHKLSRTRLETLPT